MNKFLEYSFRSYILFCDQDFFGRERWTFLLNICYKYIWYRGGTDSLRSSSPGWINLALRTVLNKYNGCVTLDPYHDWNYYGPSWQNVNVPSVFMKSWFVERYFSTLLQLNQHKWFNLRRYWIMFYFKFFNHINRLICWILVWEENLFLKKYYSSSDYLIMINIFSRNLTKQTLIDLLFFWNTVNQDR